VVTTQIKNMNMDKLLSYPLTDVAAYTVGHLMCSNSKLGEEFINQFNKKLHKLYKSEMFFNAQATKISTENKNEFIQYFNKVFRQ